MVEQAENSLPINYGISIEDLSRVTPIVSMIYEEVSSCKLDDYQNELLSPDYLESQLSQPGSPGIEFIFGKSVNQLIINRRDGLLVFRIMNLNKDGGLERKFQTQLNTFLAESGLGHLIRG